MKPLAGTVLAIACLGLAQWPNSAAAAPGRVDTTRRAKVSTETKAKLPEQVPVQKNEVLQDRRFGTETLPKEEALVGERRSDIAVEERREKELIKPELREQPKVERKENPWSGKKSRFSTGEDAYRTQMAERFQDKINDAWQSPQATRKVVDQRTTFDRINRFAFRRNPDQGVTTTRAGSEQAPVDLTGRSSLSSGAGTTEGATPTATPPPAAPR